MMKFTKNILAIFLIFVLSASFVSVVYSEESSEKAKQILENTYKKYSDLVKKDAKGLKSIAAKVSIKGSGQMPMGGSGSMPLDIDATVELYAAQPHDLNLEISGNLGNAKIVVSGKDKMTATIMLPVTKQFATMDLPQRISQQLQKDDPQKPDKMEDLWKEAILTYDGMQNMKVGKAHKITIKPKDPAEKGFVTVFILDDKWDPARLEVNDPEGGKLIVEVEKLEPNVNIPDKKFVPDTAGYTQIPNQQIMGVIMMQIMTSMMQQEKGE